MGATGITDNAEHDFRGKPVRPQFVPLCHANPSIFHARPGLGQFHGKISGLEGHEISWLSTLGVYDSHDLTGTCIESHG